jgi:hypothetical protein
VYFCVFGGGVAVVDLGMIDGAVAAGVYVLCDVNDED